MKNKIICPNCKSSFEMEGLFLDVSRRLQKIKELVNQMNIILNQDFYGVTGGKK